MNGIYLANKYLHDALRAEGFNTITFGVVTETDLNKQTIYPMVHITLVDRTLTGNTDQFNYNLQLLDLVDVNAIDPREVKNDMSLTNNVEDIFHDLGYRFNRAWKQFKHDAATIVDVDESVTLTAGYKEAQNMLAGYETSFTLTLPNVDICD